MKALRIRDPTNPARFKIGGQNWEKVREGVYRYLYTEPKIYGTDDWSVDPVSTLFVDGKTGLVYRKPEDCLGARGSK